MKIKDFLENFNGDNHIKIYDSYDFSTHRYNHVQEAISSYGYFTVKSWDMDKPNKIKAKLIVEVEAEFYDNESSEETLRYCVEQDLEDTGLNVIDVSVIE